MSVHSPSAPLLNWQIRHDIAMQQAERDRIIATLKRQAPGSHRAIELRAELRTETAKLLEMERKLRTP